MTQQIPVFVYGTLRTNEGNYSWALAGRTISETTATLDGARMWTNGGFPFVSMTDATANDTVVGDLMVINPDVYNDVMNDLDGLEGYHGPDYPANMYDRVLVTVTTDTGEQIEAYTYLVSASLFERRVRNGLPRIESGDWLAHTHPSLTAHGW